MGHDEGNFIDNIHSTMAPISLDFEVIIKAIHFSGGRSSLSHRWNTQKK